MKLTTEQAIEAYNNGCEPYIIKDSMFKKHYLKNNETGISYPVRPKIGEKLFQMASKRKTEWLIDPLKWQPSSLAQN